MAKIEDHNAESNSKKRGTSSRKIVTIRPSKRPKVDNATKSTIIKRQRMKFRDDLDLLLSIVDEIGRMHDCYREGIIDKTEALKDICNTAEHVKENLDIMKGLRKYSIPLKGQDGVPYAMLNVFNYGVKLYFDILSLFVRVSQFVFKYNNLHSKFHEFSKALLSIPLEQYIDIKRNDTMEKVLKDARYISREFLVDKSNDCEFKILKADHNALKKCVKKFNFYLDILGETLEK